jgi:hypothetical protein
MMSFVVKVILDESEHAGGEGKVVVALYCDRCRRWGSPKTTHLCGTTWKESLLALLMEGSAEDGAINDEATDRAKEARDAGRQNGSRGTSK